MILFATSGCSNDVKKRLDALEYVEGEHYLLQDVQQPVKQGGYTMSKHYYLTPDAFFLALQRVHKWIIHFLCKIEA